MDINNVAALCSWPLSTLEGINATDEEVDLALELIRGEQQALKDRLALINLRMGHLLLEEQVREQEKERGAAEG